MVVFIKLTYDTERAREPTPNYLAINRNVKARVQRGIKEFVQRSLKLLGLVEKEVDSAYESIAMSVCEHSRRGGE